ncbi:MAG: hypothetical protein M1818_008030 [Claussenomyces sp. TS43310]|nr:MAG: hypothetical protein M1818_008030 [Claussenomyces sp. TS43310]
MSASQYAADCDMEPAPPLASCESPMHRLQISESVQTPPVSSAQSLIELFTGKLGSDADNITLSKAEVRDIIQHLEPSVESTAQVPTYRESGEVEDELKKLKAQCRLGDYAGRVFNDLKSQWSGPYQLQRADLLATDLQAAEVVEKRRGKNARLTQVAYAFRNSVANLPQKPQCEDPMTGDTAKLAVYAYSARNLACHSKSLQHKTGEDWDGLAQQISVDLQELPDFLPADQHEHLADWRRIILYFRDRYIRPRPDGSWIRVAEKEFSDEDSREPPRPIDVRSLPSDLRSAPFNFGKFRKSTLVPRQARARRDGARTDPTEDGKRKRDDDPSESLEGEPSAKTPKLDEGAKKKALSKEAELKEEHRKLVLQLHHALQQIADKNMGISLKVTRECLSRGRQELEELEEKQGREEEKKGKKAEKKEKRRQNKLSGSVLLG